MKKLTVLMTILIMASVWSRISFTEAWDGFINGKARPMTWVRQHQDSPSRSNDSTGNGNETSHGGYPDEPGSEGHEGGGKGGGPDRSRDHSIN